MPALASLKPSGVTCGPCWAVTFRLPTACASTRSTSAWAEHRPSFALTLLKRKRWQGFDRLSPNAGARFLHVFRLTIVERHQSALSKAHG
jgi:hypothetical protein